MGTHARKHPSATPVNASVRPSGSQACSLLPANARESFPRFVELSPAPCLSLPQPASAVRASSAFAMPADVRAARRLRSFAAAVFFSPKKNPLLRLRAIIVHPFRSSEPVRLSQPRITPKSGMSPGQRHHVTGMISKTRPQPCRRLDSAPALRIVSSTRRTHRELGPKPQASPGRGDVS